MLTCIDLTQRFGKIYRVNYEESHRAAYGPNGKTDDPWLKIIPCQRGHIFPWGGNRLAASTKTIGPTAKALRVMPGVEVVQDGSDGVTVIFDVGLFDRVAKMLKPWRKRHLSAEHRRRLTESGVAALKRYREANVESPRNVEFCVPMENLT
ncbi:MAG: hypothetical protein IT426_16800 [Pirellulales bacterium]|nr:hypothetical protein [Pirellulales bacterium]